MCVCVCVCVCVCECDSFIAVFGLVAFMHNVFISINIRICYPALLGRHRALFPFFEGDCHGDFDTHDPNKFAHVRESAAGATTEATTSQMLVRGDVGQTTVAQQRA